MGWGLGGEERKNPTKQVSVYCAGNEQEKESVKKVDGVGGMSISQLTEIA